MNEGGGAILREGSRAARAPNTKTRMSVRAVVVVHQGEKEDVVSHFDAYSQITASRPQMGAGAGTAGRKNKNTWTHQTCGDFYTPWRLWKQIHRFPMLGSGVVLPPLSDAKHVPHQHAPSPTQWVDFNDAHKAPATNAKAIKRELRVLIS